MMASNRLTPQIEEYIAYKRSLGYMIKVESQELRRFAKYTVSVKLKAQKKCAKNPAR